MGKTIKFKCDSFGFIPETFIEGQLQPAGHTPLTKLDWNFKTSDIVMIGDSNEGYSLEYIPADVIEKYNIPPIEADPQDVVFPATIITTSDIMWPTGLPTPDSELGIYHMLVNLNAAIDEDAQEIVFGDVKNATQATEMLANALAAKPGDGIIDLGDLQKIGYILVYSNMTSYPRTNEDIFPFNPEP